MQAKNMSAKNLPSQPTVLTIGALSQRTGVNIETIRYYERISLLPEPFRSEGRRRLYDDRLAQRLQFVRRGRELGFSIEEIRALRLVDQDGLACAEAKDITLSHLADIRSKIADLKKLERVLARMASACEGNQLRQCPIFDALSQRA